MKKILVVLIAFIASIQARGVQAQVMYGSPEDMTKNYTSVYIIAAVASVLIFAVIGLVSTIIFIVKKISKKNNRQIEPSPDQSPKLPPQQDTTDTQK